MILVSLIIQLLGKLTQKNSIFAFLNVLRYNRYNPYNSIFKIFVTFMNDQITVLLIDDQSIIGEAIGRMLKPDPEIKFHYCNDPTRAMRIAQECQPTVILQDLVMPQMEGLLLLKFLRSQDSLTVDIPLIVLSSKEEPIIKAKAFELGANDYLVKLPDPVELIARIKYHSKAYINLLKRQEAEREIISLNEKLKEENLRLGAELDVARQLQQMVLPKPEELENIEGVDIAGYMSPADEVGGDYYDVLHTDGVITIGIGDVTGHGLESGILMLMTQTAVRTLQEVKETDPVKFLDTLNRTLYKNIQRMNSEKNLTLAILNYIDNKISVSGQHEETLIVRKDRKIERIDTMDLGFPIGLDDDIECFIAQTLVELNSGDGVVLYTDGITEAENMEKEQYGLDRLCEVISNHWHLTAEEIKNAVINNLTEFIGKQKVFDDITLLILKQN
jgi:sigma-B regulation protein RsbU (phosphoserine phosphatase)